MHKSVFARFNVALLAWALVFLSVGGVGLTMLDRAGRLPPPPLTATNCIDEKFKFLHDSAIRDPDLIAVGSSVTWRNLDFSVLERRHGNRVRALNAAPCYLTVNETAFLTRFYLDNMPSVRVVLSVFAMRDFEGCRGAGAFFDVDVARRYIVEGKPAWHLYFLNFRPYVFLKDVVRIRDMRTGANVTGPLNMDRFGSGPLFLTPPEIRSDVWTSPDCFDRLERMAHEIEERGVKWVVALLPPMPAWLEAYDPGGARDRTWRESVAERLRGTQAIVMDGRNGPPVKDRNFSDPAHLHWASVPTFTSWLVDEMVSEAVLAPGSLGVAHAF